MPQPYPKIGSSRSKESGSAGSHAGKLPPAVNARNRSRVEAEQVFDRAHRAHDGGRHEPWLAPHPVQGSLQAGVTGQVRVGVSSTVSALAQPPSSATALLFPPVASVNAVDRQTLKRSP